MKRKVLLMGRSGSGKTSMRSLIFSTYRAEDTKRLGSTIEVEHSHVRFLGNLVLNLWDCGGQKTYMDSYMDAQRGHVFSSVGVLIYVFDLVATVDPDDDRREWESDLRNYKDIVSALKEYSPGAQVFCLLHKMDLIDPARREELYKSRVIDLQRATREGAGVEVDNKKTNNAPPMRLHCFATSIWDATLYRAWSAIIHVLIPDTAKLGTRLAQLAQTCSATEAVIFEKATFLAILSYSTDPCAKLATAELPLWSTDDAQIMSGFPASLAPGGGQRPPWELPESRFERISDIVKQFNKASVGTEHPFQALELRTATMTVLLDRLTLSTYILIVTTDPRIRVYNANPELSAIKRCIEQSRPYFEDHAVSAT